MKRVVAPVGHDRGAGLECLLDIEDGRQLLQVELDLRHRFQGRCLRLGDDGDDRLALVTDAVLGQHELLLGLHPDEAQDRVAVVRDVAGRQGTDEAGNPLGGGEVDAPDPRVMERAPDHLQVEHAREGAVGGVPGAARHVADPVTPSDRVADDVEVGAHRGCPSSPACIAWRRDLDRSDDRSVPRAPADVARQRLRDVAAVRCRVVIEERLREHRHPRRAVAALECVGVQERLLQRVQSLRRRETLEGGHALPGDVLDRQQAGQHRLVIDENGAARRSRPGGSLPSWP